MKCIIDYLLTEKALVTEGMHWPADYVKKAITRIKAAPIGQQSWYTDNYIKTDVNNIVSDFAPLSHDSKNLGYFLVIIRWFIEYSGTNTQKYQQFLETFLSGVVKTLLIVSKDTTLSSQYKDKIKQMSFADFQKIQKQIDSKSKGVDLGNVTRKKYVITPIDSYSQMNKLFGGSKTGAGINGKGWCHTNGEQTYNNWISKKSEKFFILAAKDWKSCKPDIFGNNAYDEYGLSLIAIKVKFTEPLTLVNATLRYNHVVAPIDNAVDNAFETFDELSKVVGFDVKKTISDYQHENGIEFRKFEVDSAGNIIVDSDITSLEGAPQKVGGDFNCSDTNITSLEGAPKEVGGDFDCAKTNITSLDGAPQKVSGDFYCYNTHITSLVGAPKEVGGGFYCSSTNITSLEGAPSNVGQNFNCSSTKITSLEGAPKEVGGDFDCAKTNITSLDGAPQKIGWSFSCARNFELTSLEGGPQKVGIDFSCYDTKITSLKGAPREVGGDFYCYNTKITKKQVDAYKKFLKHPTPEHIDETGHYKP